LDLGKWDVGISEDQLAVRSKLGNTVVSFPREGLHVEAGLRRRLGYYVAPSALFVLAFYFTALFMYEAFSHEWELLAVLPLFLSPFIIRRFTSGFRVIGYYFAISTVFSFTVGSYKDNPYGSGVVLFFVLGLIPYIASKVMVPVWEEEEVTLSSGPTRYSFVCPPSKWDTIRSMLSS
jgi:hypothetical protein